MTAAMIFYGRNLSCLSLKNVLLIQLIMYLIRMLIVMSDDSFSKPLNREKDQHIKTMEAR